jgi:hypothetical protein
MKIKTISGKEKDEFMKKFEENIEDLLLIAKMKSYDGSIKFNKRNDCFGLKIEGRQGRCNLSVNFNFVREEKEQEITIYETNMVIDYTEFIASLLSKIKKDNTEEYWEEHHICNNRQSFGFKSKNIDSVFDIFQEIKNII